MIRYNTHTDERTCIALAERHRRHWEARREIEQQRAAEQEPAEFDHSVPDPGSTVISVVTDGMRKDIFVGHWQHLPEPVPAPSAGWTVGEVICALMITGAILAVGYVLALFGGYIR